MNEKLALSDDILMKIEKPARYIGNEVNAVVKDLNNIDVRFVCASPMSTRLACPIWAFRSCTACSTPGTMSGVRESILPGWI